MKKTAVYAIILTMLFMTVLSLAAVIHPAQAQDPDTTAPSGSIVINADDPATNSVSAALTLSAVDPESGVAQMSFSNDGSSWSDWEAYATLKSWNMTPEDGTKTVYVQFKNGAGLNSTSYSDDIVLDTMTPTGSVVINNGDAYVAFTSVTLNLTYSDDTGSGVSQVRYSNDGLWDTEQWETPALSKEWNLTVGDEDKTVYYQINDTAGNQAVFTDTIILDTTAPTGTISINNGATYTTSASVTLILSASDTNGVFNMTFSADGSTWGSWEAYTTSRLRSLTSPDGSKDVYVKFMDAAGLESTAYSDGIILDTTPPNGSISINNDVAYTSSTSVTLNLTYSDDTGSGVFQVRYSNNETWNSEPWETPASSKEWSLTAGDGTKTVYYQINDTAGNQAVYSDTISLVTSGPSGSIIINDDDAATSSTSVTLSLNYSDSESGVSKVRYSNADTWDTEEWENPVATKAWNLTSEDGTKTVYYQVKNNANLTSTFSDTILLDTLPPNGSIIINGNSTYSNSTTVTLTLTATDATSGVTQIRLSNDGEWDTEPWETPAESKSWSLSPVDGNKTVHYQIKDNANNTANLADTIILDTTAPTGSISINIGAPYTTSTSVALSLTYSDTGSNVSQVRYSNDGTWDTEPWETPAASKPWPLAAGDGTKIVYYQIRDNAGLPSLIYADTILLDTAPPTGSIIINNGDVSTPSDSVTLSLTYSDEGSGVFQVRYNNDATWDNESWETPVASSPWSLSSGDGTKTVYYQIRDNAGSLSPTYSDTILLDTTPPTGSIIINGGAIYSNSTKVTLALTASDTTSGVTQIRLSNDGEWDTEPWETWLSTKTWTLTTGDEIKNVYYQIKDRAGSTETFSSWIFLDMTLPVANAGQNQTVTTGQSVTFNGGGSRDNLDIASYSWDFGDGSTGTGVAPTHTYSSAGTFTVRLMVKDLAGNSAASGATVTVQVVIPEFPSILALILFVMLASTFVLAFKKRSNNPFQPRQIASHSRHKKFTSPSRHLFS